MFLFCAADGTKSINSLLLQDSDLVRDVRTAGTYLVHLSIALHCAWLGTIQSSFATGPTVLVSTTLTWAYQPIPIQLPENFANTIQQIDWTCDFGILEGGHQGSLRLPCWWNNCCKKRRSADKEYHFSAASIKFAWFSAVKFVSSWSGAKANKFITGLASYSLAGYTMQWNVLRPWTSHQIQLHNKLQTLPCWQIPFSTAFTALNRHFLSVLTEMNSSFVLPCVRSFSQNANSCSSMVIHSSHLNMLVDHAVSNM